MSLTEGLKDVGNQLAERVRSPLYSVFILAWIVSNWKAFYITVFENVKTLGCSKIYYLTERLYPLSDCSTYFKLFIAPIIATVLFIWVMPKLVFWAFKITESYSQKRREEKMRILGQSVIQGEKYMALRKKYEERMEEYSNIINEESENKMKLSELELDKQKLEIEKNEVENKLKLGTVEIGKLKRELENANRLIEKMREELEEVKYNAEDIFDGVWLNQYQIPGKGVAKEYFQIIEGNRYLTADTPDSTQWEEVFKLEGFEYSKELGQIKFTKIPLGKQNLPSIKVLLNRDFIDWKGYENGNIPVTYSKIITSDL